MYLKSLFIVFLFFIQTTFVLATFTLKLAEIRNETDENYSLIPQYIDSQMREDTQKIYTIQNDSISILNDLFEWDKIDSIANLTSRPSKNFYLFNSFEEKGYQLNSFALYSDKRGDIGLLTAYIWQDNYFKQHRTFSASALVCVRFEDKKNNKVIDLFNGNIFSPPFIDVNCASEELKVFLSIAKEDEKELAIKVVRTEINKREL